MNRVGWLVLFLSAVCCYGDDNLIDRYVFKKASHDQVPVAPLSSDTEFLRRVYLDVTGRLPEPKVVRKFIADTDSNKRNKLIDSLFPPLPEPGMRSITEDPYFDRWTSFFGDLFGNGQLLAEGANTFYDYLYKALTLNIPYNEFVQEMLTASTISTWTNGAANMIARWHVFEGDGFQINHEDTADEIAIRTTKMFLGVNLECVSCHDGKGHLEKINLWLADRKRADVWRQASFFGKTYIAPVYGRSPQFMIKDSASGYDLGTVSSLRPMRNKRADITPSFVLDGQHAEPTEKPREAYARMITSNPQFARAIVNLIWAELMGVGIVDPPLDFDLARQDPADPPPAPWTIQPSNPELLKALATDFREHGYDLRRLIRLIVSSRTYQLSTRFDGSWKDSYDNYFVRRKARRMSAEQIWDSIGQLTGVFPSITVGPPTRKVNYVMQAHSPLDTSKSQKPLADMLQSFGQCDRYTAEADRRASMVQAAALLNDKLVRDRVKIQKGSRLEKLLKGEKPKPYPEVVDELFLVSLSRLPTEREKTLGVETLKEFGDQGAEDLVWALINKLEFLFY